MNEKPKRNNGLGPENGDTGPVTSVAARFQSGPCTLRQVRQEMAACYRAAKQGAIPPQDLVTLIYALSQIAKVIEIDELERRMNALQGIAEANEWTH